MATVKYPEAWGLDVFFEGGSESPVRYQFLNDLSVKVEIGVTKVKALASQLRYVLNPLTNGLMEISNAGGMLSCLTVQNTKDTKAKEQSTGMIIVADLATQHLVEEMTKRTFGEKGIKLCVRDVEAFIQFVSKER